MAASTSLAKRALLNFSQIALACSEVLSPLSSAQLTEAHQPPAMSVMIGQASSITAPMSIVRMIVLRRRSRAIVAERLNPPLLQSGRGVPLACHLTALLAAFGSCLRCLHDAMPKKTAVHTTAIRRELARSPGQLSFNPKAS